VSTRIGVASWARLKEFQLVVVVVSVAWIVASAAAHLVPSVAGAEVTSWVLLAIAVMSVGVRIRNRREVDTRWTWPEAGALLVLAAAVVALVVNPAASSGGTLRVLQHLTIVLAVASLQSTWRSVRLVTLGLVVGIAIQVVVALAELGLGRTFFYSLWKPLEAASWHGFLRLGSTPADPNYLALGVVSTLPVIWTLHGIAPVSRAVSVVATLGWLVVATLTFSRAGYVGVILAPVVYSVVYRGSRPLLAAIRPRVSGRSLIAVAAVIVLALVLRDQLLAVIARVISVGGGTTDASINTRVAAQIAAVLVFIAHPLGIGFDQFVSVGPAYVAAISTVRVSEINVLDSYLLTAAEGGVLGLLGFIIATLSTFCAFRASRYGDRGTAVDSLNRKVIAGLAAGFIIWSLMSFTLDAFHSPVEWVFIGLGALIARAGPRATRGGLARAANSTPTPEQSDRKQVGVVVVSYNTRAATLRCLEALHRSTDVTLSIVLIDNGSDDGTAAAARAAYRDVNVIENATNAGFGAACNRGISATLTPYVLILNSDCFVRPDTIARSVAFLRAHLDSSAVACQLVSEDGARQPSCRRFPTIRSEFVRAVLPFQLLRRVPILGGYFLGGWDYNDTRTVDQPAGAYLLIRRGAWGDGPAFDERYFMYYEDVDLCRRLWAHGPIWFLADARAVHLAEHSSSRIRSEMAAALAVSRYRYFEKWSGEAAARVVSLIGTIGSLLRAIAWTAAAPLGRDAGRSRAGAHATAVRASVRLWLRPGTVADR
jgi:N-acetylglucosaminyl-diphospho-decaprenol L-rhamnosyltransferase